MTGFDEVDPAQARMDDRMSDLLDDLAAIDVPVRFWRCPVPEHRGGPLRVEVEWRGGIAHCAWPSCGRSSASPEEPS